MDKIIIKVACVGGAGVVFWLFLNMLMGVAWDQFSHVTLVTQMGFLMEAIIALAGMGGACVGAYFVCKRM